MSKETAKDVAVVTCFFDFAGNENLKKNFEKFYESIKKTGYPIFVAEVLSDEPNFTKGQPTKHKDPVLKDIVKENYFSLDISQPFWCRENIINVMVDYFVPESYTKIVWIDPNVIIENPKWLDAMSDLLERKDLVHVGSEFLKLDEGGKVALSEMGAAKSLSSGNDVSHIRENSNLGVGWGVKRDFFKKLGIFDLDFSGAGDALTFLSAIGVMTENDSELLEKYKEQNLETFYSIMNYNTLSIGEKLSVSYINQSVNILYSGDYSVKKYNRAFDPSSLDLLSHFDYGEHFVLDKDRFNSPAGEHVPFYRTPPQVHFYCQYFKKFIDHIVYKDSKDKLQSIDEIRQPPKNIVKTDSQKPEITIPSAAMGHLLKSWTDAREEAGAKKIEYERALRKEEAIYESFRKGMKDSMRL